MATATGVPADAGIGGRPAGRPGRMVAALAVTQTIGHRNAGQCSGLQAGGEGPRWAGR